MSSISVNIDVRDVHNDDHHRIIDTTNHVDAVTREPYGLPYDDRVNTVSVSTVTHVNPVIVSNDENVSKLIFMNSVGVYRANSHVHEEDIYLRVYTLKLNDNPRSEFLAHYLYMDQNSTHLASILGEINEDVKHIGVYYNQDNNTFYILVNPDVDPAPPVMNLFIPYPEETVIYTTEAGIGFLLTSDSNDQLSASAHEYYRVRDGSDAVRTILTSRPVYIRGGYTISDSLNMYIKLYFYENTLCFSIGGYAVAYDTLESFQGSTDSIFYDTGLTISNYDIAPSLVVLANGTLIQNPISLGNITQYGIPVAHVFKISWIPDLSHGPIYSTPGGVVFQRSIDIPDDEYPTFLDELNPIGGTIPVSHLRVTQFVSDIPARMVPGIQTPVEPQQPQQRWRPMQKTIFSPVEYQPSTSSPPSGMMDIPTLARTPRRSRGLRRLSAERVGLVGELPPMEGRLSPTGGFQTPEARSPILTPPAPGRLRRQGGFTNLELPPMGDRFSPAGTMSPIRSPTGYGRQSNSLFGIHESDEPTPRQITEALIAHLYPIPNKPYEPPVYIGQYKWISKAELNILTRTVPIAKQHIRNEYRYLAGPPGTTNNVYFVTLDNGKRFYYIGFGDIL
jgi:hypothetical protein